jgi:hypothetical protein
MVQPSSWRTGRVSRSTIALNAAVSGSTAVSWTRSSSAPYRARRRNPHRERGYDDDSGYRKKRRGSFLDDIFDF